MELSNLEVLDCTNFSNYKNLLDIESCFANCPMDICLIVKDNYMRSLLKESIKKFLIFTEFEFYEEGLKDTWEFKDLFETLSTFVEGKYYKLLRLNYQDVYIFKHFNLKANYFKIYLKEVLWILRKF